MLLNFDDTIQNKSFNVNIQLTHQKKRKTDVFLFFLNCWKRLRTNYLSILPFSPKKSTLIRKYICVKLK